MRDSGADGLDHARHFVAEDPRVRRFRRIERERLEHVAEIHARGFHFDHHLARAAGWQGERHQFQRVQQSALAGLEPQRHRGFEHLLAWLRGHG